jgi:hypothetical protein
MNNALLYFGGILITALAVLFAVPHFIDWNSYRGVFEEEATRILGREVRVGGGVNVRLLPSPFIRFEKLRISDAGEDGGNSIIRVESFTMWLSVPPLLRGVLEANRVELRKPVIHLAINSEGSGNWRSLALSPGSTSFVPQDVALQSVKISDGAVVLSTAAHGELARFDQIDGELSADALEGPFKFKGEMGWNGTPRQVKIATAKRDTNGDLRFKAAVDVADSQNSYVLDGKITDLAGTPKLEGDLIAKLRVGAHAPGSHAEAPALYKTAGAATDAEPAPAAVPSKSPLVPDEGDPFAAEKPAQQASPPPAKQPAPEAGASAAAGGAPGFELRAKVKGDTSGIALGDVAVTLEASGAPQLITGSAKMDWSDKMRFDVALSSRWLDLDKLSPGGVAAGIPLEAARGYFEALAAALPSEADTNARLEFDQLTLGGEPISNVRLAASRSGGPLELKGVQADLPGGTRLQLDGVLEQEGNGPRLDGTLFVAGKSLMRFMGWGLGRTDLARDRTDGPFALDGHFALGNGTIALSKAAFEVAGTPLTGELKLDLGKEKRIALAVEGARIDAAQVGSGVGLTTLHALLFGNEPGSATVVGATPPDTDLSLRLKVAELVDGARVLRDVDADITLEHGTLSIPGLKFSTPDGLYVEAEGRAKDVSARPQGTIRGLVSAPSPEAARTLLALLDTAPDAKLNRLAGLAPFRVAGTLNLTGGTTNAAALTLDGTAAGGRVTASLRLDGGGSAWRTSPFDLEVRLDTTDVAPNVGALFDTRRARASPQAPKPGHAVVKMAGIPVAGLVSIADVTADGYALGYRGRVTVDDGGDARAAGEVKVRFADAADGLALAGLSLPPGPGPVPLDGTITVSLDKAGVRLDSERLAIGESTLNGHVALASTAPGKQSIDADIRADKATVAAVLAPILGASEAALAAAPPGVPVPRPAERNPGVVAAAAAEPGAPIWPEQAFDLTLLDRLQGKVEVAVGALSIEPGLALGNAKISAELAPGAITVRHFDGDAVGGRMTSHLDLARAPAGVGLTGGLRIDISSKKPAPTDSAPAPGDVASFGVDFTSRALSPAALITGLTGKGELTVGDATLTGNSPAAVSGVVRAALTGQGPNGGQALADAVKAALKQGNVRLGKLTIPAELSDGALKLDRVRVEMAEGRSSFTTAVELETMRIDSEWQIEPKLDSALSNNPTRALLPPVTVVYTGKLASLATLEPTVSASALERELVVRKMELDVGELERLRKQDQERAREDAERRKALEADQPTPSPPVPSPPPPEAQAPAPIDGSSGQEAVPGGWDTSASTPGLLPNGQPNLAADGQAIPPEVAPSPAATRPARRKRPSDEEWRPFQTPY